MKGKASAKVFFAVVAVFAAAILLFPLRAAAQNSPTWSPTSVEIPGQGPLKGVSCTWIAFCVAVDAHGNAFTYDGLTWTLTNIDGTTALDSVSCVSPAFCMVGDNLGRVLTFNGVTWSAPQQIDPNTPISSVSCPSANFCAAVDGNGDAMVYNGSGWSPPFLLDPVLQGSVQGVSCPTLGFCMAVDQNGKAYTFNGSTWSKPVVVNANAYFYGVSCASQTFCVAADYNFGAVYTYTGSWSGPNNIDSHSFPSLLAVSCASQSFCVAVDPYGNALTYNGASWSTNQIVPSSGTAGNLVLSAVSCPSSTFCAAVNLGNVLMYSKVFAFGKIVDLSTISPGQQALTYTLAAVNRGSSGVTGVTVTDNLPSGASLVSATSTQGSCSGTATLTCDVGSLAAGAAARITIQVTANWAGGTTITNTADGVSVEYPNTSDNTSTATTIVSNAGTGAATTTFLAASVNPSVFGQQVSLTATVTPTASSANIPSGTVTFSDGVTSLGSSILSNGTAVFNIAALVVGNHSLTAFYSGDSNFAASTSAALTETVSQAGTTTGLAASPNPASFGQAVTLTVTVTVGAPGAGTPTGTVTFLDGATALGTATLNGGATAIFSTSSLAAGSHSVTASYSGDTNFTGSVTSSAITVTVQAPPPPVVQITDNETVLVTDVVSSPDVFDSEAIKVTDQVTVYAFFPIAISPAPPILSAVLNQPYSGVTFSGTGGYQSLTLSESGAVPGMSFTIAGASATFSGTPTQAGTFPFTITATDSIGNKLSQNYSLMVSAVCPAISVTPLGPLGIVTVGNPFSQTFVASGGVGTTALSTASALPVGMNFSAGVLSGIPSQYGTFALIITATDQNGCQGSSNVSLLVVPPPAVITDSETINVTDTVSFPDIVDSEKIKVSDQVKVYAFYPITVAPTGVLSGVANQPYPQTTFTGAGGYGALTLSETGSIPGLQFAGSGASMVLSGKPAAGSPPGGYPFTITAADSIGNTFSQNYALVVAASCPAITVSPSGSLGTVITGSSLSQTFTATGGIGTTLLTTTSALPTGVGFGGGVVSGTPTQTGAFTITITATDQNGCQGSTMVSLLVVPPPAVITDNETINVADTESFPDVFDSEAIIKVTDQITITVLNTSPGSGVSVTPVDTTTGTGPVTLTFSQVLQPGNTSLTTTSTGPSAPSGFQPGNPPVYYNLSTTAVFSGSVTICINYAGITFTQPPRLFHYENGGWVDHTTSVNTISMIVCGSVTSLSPFALFQQSIFPTTTSISAAGVTYGTAANATVSVSSAGGVVSGNVMLSVDGGAAFNIPLTGGSTTFSLGVLSAGNHNLTASFAAQGTFGASSATGTITISQATPVITWANPAPITYGTPLSNAQLNATASVAGAFTYSPPTGTILTAGSQTVSAKFNPVDTANYTPAAAIVTLQVNQATPAIKWPNPVPITYGTPLSSTQLNATASVPGTFTYTPPAGTVLTVGSQTLSAIFAPADSTNYTKATASATLQVACGVLINLSSSSVTVGGAITVTGKVISCSNTAQTVVVQFSLSGPSQPNSCSSTQSVMFTSPPFTLLPKTSQTVSFPFKVPSGVCPGTYTITATTHANSATGTVLNTSTASLMITAH